MDKHFKLIYKVAIPAPVYQLFDYFAPDDAQPLETKPGTRLEVPFGRGTKIAFLVAVADHTDLPDAKLKQVTRILDTKPLFSEQDMALLLWASRYYHHPLGEVISTALPTELRKGGQATIKGEQRFQLTGLGKSTASSRLSRSPKQKALLEKFQAESTLISHAELASCYGSNWRSSVNLLIGKGLLETVTDLGQQKDRSALTKTAALQCNPQQQAAISAVSGQLGKFGVFLLEGVTGSGKTEVYMQIIQAVLALGRQVLVLVPEITLTPQLEGRFKQRFAADIAITHSKLTDNQRQAAWLQFQQGQAAILLGTRSALFTPFQHPGLIILDEEHDASFKQQEGFRFSARDVAVVRGKFLDIPVLLGSATPSLESLYNVQKNRYQWLHLPERAGGSIAPELNVLDIRNKKMHEGLSEMLLAQIRQTVANHEQVLLFLNRRGFAPTLICHACGWVGRCLRCDANLVIHRRDHLLRCHHCGHEQHLPGQCPACLDPQLTALGLGTERVEKMLAEHFAEQTIIRLDRDSTQRKGALEDYLAKIQAGEVDIILGTQMLAKGHHFPNVTLVAIVDVDSGLFSIDFHAAEKLAQLVVQVSGRAGRAAKPGKVILQTRRPDHPLITTLIHSGYQRFAEIALAERQLAQLPPYSYQALLRAQAGNAQLPWEFLEQVAKLAQALANNETAVLGPVTAPMAKRAGQYRYQLLFQSNKRQALHHLLDKVINEIDRLKLAKKLRWSLDVDPVDLY